MLCNDAPIRDDPELEDYNVDDVVQRFLLVAKSQVCWDRLKFSAASFNWIQATQYIYFWVWGEFAKLGINGHNGNSTNIPI